MSIKGDSMYPDWAFVDADLLQTLPPTYVAWTGMDALTHALEATLCRFANPASDALARAPSPSSSLPAAGGRGRRPRRPRPGGGGAGLDPCRMAFGNADVGAVHCLSETIGARWNTPHGLANAVLLAPVLRSHLSAPAARHPARRPGDRPPRRPQRRGTTRSGRAGPPLGRGARPRRRHPELRRPGDSPRGLTPGSPSAPP